MFWRGEREWQRDLGLEKISRDPGQLWGLSWSGGLHLSTLEGPRSLSFSLSSLCLSLFLSSWTCRSLSTLHPASTAQIQASSVQPCVAISGNSFRMLPVHCTHCSLSQSLLYLSLHPHNPPSKCLPLCYLANLCYKCSGIRRNQQISSV